MHIFFVTMSGYSQIIYCMQEKLTHFDLELSIVYVTLSLYVLNCLKYFLIYFGTKFTKKSDKKYLNCIKSLEENASKLSYSTY